MNDSLRGLKQEKKKNSRLIILLSLSSLILLVLITVGVVWFIGKQNGGIQQANGTQDLNHQKGPSFSLNEESTILDAFKEESTEIEWVIKGEFSCFTSI